MPLSTAATRITKTMCGASKRCCLRGIDYLDAGTSGGVWGVERGYCLMIGGERKHLTGSSRFSKPGSGHWRHPSTPGRARNGEYCREGLFVLPGLRRGPFREDDPQRHRVWTDAGVRGGIRYHEAGRLPNQLPEGYGMTSILADIAELWRRGSVVVPGCWI